jgi:glycosyltransferase involved in cell wall biosynthesis
VVEGHRAALAAAGISHELILVVNASSDGSLEVCRGLAERLGGMRVLQLDRPGWGRAVREGIRHSRGRVICYANSARTAPDTLTRAARYALADPDAVVKVSRRVRESFRRRLGSVLYNLECRALFDLPMWDVNGTPKAFGRHHQALLGLSRDDDLIDLEFCIACRRNGVPVLELPVVSGRRHGGRSTTNMRSAVRMYAGALRMWLATRRAAGR